MPVQIVDDSRISFLETISNTAKQLCQERIKQNKECIKHLLIAKDTNKKELHESKRHGNAANTL